MNPRLVEYYNRELAYLRELGTEFAAAFPKVASRLALKDTDVADPYVERLLEGFSFLSARVQIKMDAEFPRFSQRILDMVCPHYLAPTPAMVVVQMQPSMQEGSLAHGFRVPPGSVMRAYKTQDEQTSCEFRTGGEIQLWPLQIVNARLSGPALDLPAPLVPQLTLAPAHLRIQLAVQGALQFSELALDKLWIYINASDVVASHIQELLHTSVLGIAIHDANDPSKVFGVLGPECLQPEGYASDQSLLPYSHRAFHGHRLLHEYFAFPARFRFFSISGMATYLKQINERSVGLTLLLGKTAPALESQVDASTLLLHCVPAINLFAIETDRIHITQNVHEYHVLPDRTRPRDFEVYSVESVTGHHEGQTVDRKFAPLYAAIHGHRALEQAYFTVRREPRLFSEQARKNGPRTQYLGSEVFLSLVDQREAPFSDELKQLSVRALCTNRDLPLLMRTGRPGGDLFLQESAPVDTVSIVAGPSTPTPAVSDGALTWRLISHLSLNYLAMTDLSAEEGAATLQELLGLYLDVGDKHLNGHITSVQSMEIEPITRRLSQHRQLIYGRGVGVTLHVDETPLAGVSPWPLANMLEHFFARHVGINSFTELRLQSRQRGPLAQWSPRMGQRPSV